jgi:hypothetical protein
MTTKKSTGSAGTKKPKVKKQIVRDLDPKGKAGVKGGKGITDGCPYMTSYGCPGRPR